MKYDFKCKCGNEFVGDVDKNMERKKCKCPKCGKMAPKHWIYAPPIDYWGDGWTKQRDFSKG